MPTRSLSRARLALALLLSLAPAPGARAIAQSFPTDDPVLRRIWALGMDSSRVEDLSSALLDSLGPRLNGTPNTRAAQDWLLRTYASWGIDARNERYGTWRGWRRGHSHVDLLTPRVRTLEATMVGHSPGTGGRDRTAEAIVLPRFADSTEFVRWLPTARGKLVLVSPPLPSCRPASSWAQHGTPEMRARMDSLRLEVQREWAGPDTRGTGYSVALGGGELGIRMEKGGVAGLLTSRAKNAWGAREVFDTYNTVAPVVSLSCEDYGLVFRLAERGARPRIRLNLDAQPLGEQPVSNTIATLRGTEKPEEYIVLSAHFDSWDGGSGATDNGAGSVVVMEAMRILKQVYPRPKRTILAGLWTGEEVGLQGSRAFVEDHPEVLKGVHAVFNTDGGTGHVTRLSATGMPDSDVHLRRWLARFPTELSSQITLPGVTAPGRGGTDDFSFYCAGAPAFGVGAVTWDYSDYTWHTESDTYDKLVFDELKSKAVVFAMLAYLASEDPTLISRERAATTMPADSTARRTPITWPTCGKAARTTAPRLR